MMKELEIPAEVRFMLNEAATINHNYDVNRLSVNLQAEIIDLLFKKNRTRRPEKDSARMIEAFCIRLAARIEQMLPNEKLNPLWEKRHRGDDHKTFFSSPRRTTKSLQEAFTDESDLVAAPRYNGVSHAAYDGEYIGSIVIDPAYVPDDLLKHAGMTDSLAPRKATKTHKLLAKIEALPELKKRVLQHLIPIPVSPELPNQVQYRLFLISAGPLAGFIIECREHGNRHHLYLKDLPAAKRASEYQRESYQDEQERLAHIATQLNAIDTLLRNWNQTKVNDERLGEVFNTLLSLVDQLSGVVDQDKQTLKRQIQKAFRFALQYNPSAALASINRVKRSHLIGHRQQKIAGISGYTGADLQMLTAHQSAEGQSVQRLYIMSMAAIKYETRLTRQDIENIRTECIEKVHFQPYLAYAQAVDVFLDLGNDCMDEKKRDEGEDFYLRAFVVSKLAAFHNFLLKLYEEFSRSGIKIIEVEPWQQRLASAINRFTEIEAGRRVFTPEFDAIWKCVRKLVKELHRVINEYDKAQNSGARRAAIDSLKKEIAAVDLTAKVQEITQYYEHEGETYAAPLGWPQPGVQRDRACSHNRKKSYSAST